MLILTRKLYQDIIIGEDIVVRVMEIDGNQVRIGIEAPPNVTVYREEIATKIRMEKMNKDLDKYGLIVQLEEGNL